MMQDSDYKKEGDSKIGKLFEIAYPTTEQDSVHFEEICKEMAEIRNRKTADYGNSWKIMGLMGVIYQIMSKSIRIWNLRNKEATNEPLRDSFRDLAVYAIMAIQLLDSKEIEPKI